MNPNTHVVFKYFKVAKCLSMRALTYLPRSSARARSRLILRGARDGSSVCLVVVPRRKLGIADEPFMDVHEMASFKRRAKAPVFETTPQYPDDDLLCVFHLETSLESTLIDDSVAHDVLERIPQSITELTRFVQSGQIHEDLNAARSRSTEAHNQVALTRTDHCQWNVAKTGPVHVVVETP